jgi:nicotinamide-nucleotide amidase
MLAEIITIGDEILIGQTIDTNSAWIGKNLNDRGIDVVQISSINDKKASIVKAIQEAEKRADLILITGGLGPTKDDITKKTLAEYFNAPLILSEVALQNIESIFAKRGRSLLQINKDQATVPSNCIVIPNTKGTAPGMYFEENGKIYVSMPGVPYEMKAMMELVVLDKIAEKVNNLTIVHRTITVVDVPESLISNNIESIELSLPQYIKLAYLPHLNLVRLRLTAKSEELNTQRLEQEIDLHFDKIKEKIGPVWFEGDRNLPEIVGELLVNNSQTIGTVESCSGGYVAHMLTSIAGSSAYFLGSLLTYAYSAKVSMVDIPQELLNSVGAVSEEVVNLMAKNGKKKLNVDYCISTSGIAGPGGGTPSKPVGLVYIGLALPDGSVEIKRCEFHGSRLQIIERTAYTALNMLRMTIISQKKGMNSV